MSKLAGFMRWMRNKKTVGDKPAVSVAAKVYVDRDHVCGTNRKCAKCIVGAAAHTVYRGARRGGKDKSSGRPICDPCLAGAATA